MYLYMGLKKVKINYFSAQLKRLDKTAVLFIFLALIFGLFFVFKTPPLWGADETTHFARAYQITQGQIISSKVDVGYGGEIPTSALKLIQYVDNDISSNTNQVIAGVKWVDNPAGYKPIVTQPINGPKSQYGFSNTAPYSPFAYLPSVIGLKIAEIFKLDLGNSITLARITGLSLFIMAIAWVIWSMKLSRSKWMVFTVALLPMTLRGNIFIKKMQYILLYA